MDIEKEVESLQKELAKVKDPIFIKAIKSLLVYSKKMEQPDWWDALTDSEKKDIEEGLKPKGINANRYVGKVDLDKDALETQKDLRKEWE